MGGLFGRDTSGDSSVNREQENKNRERQAKLDAQEKKQKRELNQRQLSALTSAGTDSTGGLGKRAKTSSLGAS